MNGSLPVSIASTRQFALAENSEVPEFTAINSQLKEAAQFADQGYNNKAREIYLAIIEDTVQLQKTGKYPDEVKRIYTELHEIAIICFSKSAGNEKHRTFEFELASSIDNELKDRALEFELDADFDNAKVIYQVIVDKPSEHGPDAEAEDRLSWLNNRDLLVKLLAFFPS